MVIYVVIINMEKQEFIKLLNEYGMDSEEVKKMLGISRQRLSDMKATKRLVPLKGNLYWREDVEAYNKQKKARRKEE